MTRKDYVLIAAALKAAFPPVVPELTWKEATLRVGQHASCCFVLANALATDNPRFDRERFLKACGVQS